MLPIQVEARVAIQGELGSNSHLAALQALGAAVQVVPCTASTDVFDAMESRRVDLAVLPIENSLHGSVAEHYDLLLARAVSVIGETSVRIRHNVLAAPGVSLNDVRRVLSHPVALSQCRRWLAEHPSIAAVPFYDTAGSVKDLMRQDARDAAAIAPELAAQVYGASVLVRGIEDHVENYTRFFVLERTPADSSDPTAQDSVDANKMSVAFRVEHRPGTLLGALQALVSRGLNLTKIESRPVPGRPWEYVFFIDLAFDDLAAAEQAIIRLEAHSSMVRVLGRYRAAPTA